MEGGAVNKRKAGYGRAGRGSGAGVFLRRTRRPEVSGMETVTKQMVVKGQQLKYLCQGDIVRQLCLYCCHPTNEDSEARCVGEGGSC